MFRPQITLQIFLGLAALATLAACGSHKTTEVKTAPGPNAAPAIFDNAQAGLPNTSAAASVSGSATTGSMPRLAGDFVFPTTPVAPPPPVPVSAPPTEANGPLGKAYRRDNFRCVNDRSEPWSAGANANWIPLTPQNGGQQLSFVATRSSVQVLTDFMLTVGVRVGVSLYLELVDANGTVVRQWLQAYLGHGGTIGIASRLSNHKHVGSLTPGMVYTVRAYLHAITSDDEACGSATYNRHLSLDQPELTVIL